MISKSTFSFIPKGRSEIYSAGGTQIAILETAFLPKTEYKLNFNDEELILKRISKASWNESVVLDKSGTEIMKFKAEKYTWINDKILFGSLTTKKSEYQSLSDKLGNLSVVKKGQKEPCLEFTFEDIETIFDSNELTLKEAICLRILVQKVYKPTALCH